MRRKDRDGAEIAGLVDLQLHWFESVKFRSGRGMENLICNGLKGLKLDEIGTEIEELLEKVTEMSHLRVSNF